MKKATISNQTLYFLLYFITIKLMKIVNTFPKTDREIALDIRVFPIIKRLQGSHAISFEQYKKKLQGDKTEDLSQTLSVFSQPHEKKKKFSSDRVEKSRRRYYLQANKPLLQSIGKVAKLSQHHIQARFLYNPQSKIKKHLAEDIEYQKPKGNLFEKRKTTNRFEYFCQGIKEKNRSHHPESRQSNSKEPFYPFESDKTVEKSQQLEEVSEAFHVTNRKKFWHQNRAQTAGFSSKLMSIQLIKRLIKS